jgi:hypothetical protein
MGRWPGARSAQPQQARGLLQPEALNGHNLGPTGLSGDQPDRRRTNPEHLGEEPNQGLVCGAVHRRGADPHPKRVTLDAGEFRARCPRLDAETEVEALGGNG